MDASLLNIWPAIGTVVLVEKTCFKCSEKKPIREFYRHSAMADGHLGKCKDCTKKDVYERSLRVPEKIQEYERWRSKQPGRLAAMAEIRKTEKFKKWASKYVKKRRALEPEKFRARSAVGNALRDGRLVKGPCAICGSRGKVQGHHYDYSKPLDVEWLCVKCHRTERHTRVVSAAA